MTKAATNHHTPLGRFADRPLPRLYDRIIEVFRVRHYSRRGSRFRLPCSNSVGGKLRRIEPSGCHPT